MDPLYLRSIGEMFFFILLSPGVMGLLRALKARLQGRRGPRISQPYFDMWKLFRKRPVLSEGTSWVFVSAPLIIFLSYCFLGLVVPVVYLPEQALVFSRLNGPPLADLLIIIYLLGLTHFVFGLAGMDSGSPFGGLGSSREMYLNLVSEPALVLSAYALALNTHTTSLPGIMRYCIENGIRNFLGTPSFWFVFLSLGIVMLLETGRIPYDNQATHLELTMIGKAVALEYSGPFLALIEWAEAMRLTFFMTLFLNLTTPFLMDTRESSPVSFLLYSGLYIARLSGLCGLLAVWEMSRAKVRLRALINTGGVALAFAVLAIIVAVARIYFF